MKEIHRSDHSFIVVDRVLTDEREGEQTEGKLNVLSGEASVKNNDLTLYF